MGKLLIAAMSLIVITASQSIALPISIDTTRDITVNISKVNGCASYGSDGLADCFQNLGYMTFNLTADSNQTVYISAPTSIVLTRSGGSETAEVNFYCKASNSFAVPVRPTDPDCTGGPPTVTSDSGKLYIAVVASKFKPDSNNFTGAYTGVYTLTANY